MKHVLVIHPLGGDETSRIEPGGRPVSIRRVGCHGDVERARSLIVENDGQVDVIGLESIPARLKLGSEQVFHETGRSLAQSARRTPVVDGSGVRAALESWAVQLIERAQPGVLSNKRTLMVPGLNHTGLAAALGRRTRRLRFADPFVFFGLPRLPGVGRASTLSKVAPTTLKILRNFSLSQLLPRPQGKSARRARSLFQWAEILAGDVRAIRILAPEQLHGKTIVVDCAEAVDVEDLRARGARNLVTLMPAVDADSAVGSRSSSVLEAVLAATRPHPELPLTEDTYLDMIAELDWSPAIHALQAGDAEVNRFAFVIHPLNLGFIHRHPGFRWTRFLPDRIVEATAALRSPMFVSRITGGRSPATGQRIEGHLIALSATPREMMRRGARFTYKRLNKAARMAQKTGARLMGLGAFTSVVGDAGITVDRESSIAITSGNSLTVAATLEAAKQAAVQMGTDDLTRGRAMIIGATGSIGSVCARMIAQAIRDVVLVSIEPEKLIELKRLIKRETPDARVTVATRSNGLVPGCDLIVCATSAFGQRILDISECKPGAIICDVARPPDIGKAEAALRPDVLVVESGEVLIPGDIDFHYDIGLPDKVAYACLAETALLAMEGRFESFTVGREIRMERVKEIYRLFGKHGFQLAGLRSLGRYLTEDDLAEKRAIAETLRANGPLLERTRRQAARRLAEIPVSSKGVRAGDGSGRSWLAGGLDTLALWLAGTKSAPKG